MWTSNYINFFDCKYLVCIQWAKLVNFGGHSVLKWKQWTVSSFPFLPWRGDSKHSRERSLAEWILLEMQKGIFPLSEQINYTFGKIPLSFLDILKVCACSKVLKHLNIFIRSISNLEKPWLKFPFFHGNRAPHLKCNMLFLQNGVFVCFLHVYMHNTYVIFYWDFYNWKITVFL